MRKDFAAKSFFFVASAAYSQLFCGLLGKYLVVSELRKLNGHIIRRVFLDYNFQWLKLAWQFVWQYVHAWNHLTF